MWWEKRCINIGITLIVWSNTPSIYGYTVHSHFFHFFCHVATFMDSCSQPWWLQYQAIPNAPLQDIQARDCLLPRWPTRMMWGPVVPRAQREVQCCRMEVFCHPLAILQGYSFLDAYPIRLVGNMMGYDICVIPPFITPSCDCWTIFDATYAQLRLSPWRLRGNSAW